MPGFVYRKVVVDGSTPDLLVMDEHGNLTAHANPEAALRAIKAQDTAAARKGQSTVTTIEWVGMPAGFVPPEIG